MPKIDLNKINPLTLVLLTVIILTFAVLLARTLLPILTVNDEAREQVGPQLDVVTDVSQRDRFAGYKITLPAGWNVSYKLASPENSEWECLDSTCQLMVITHDADNAKLTKIVLTTPVAVRFQWNVARAMGEQSITIAGEQLTVDTEKYMTVNESGTIASTLLLQMYGCNSDLLCINAGPFSPEAGINLEQQIELNSFLEQVILERI